MKIFVVVVCVVSMVYGEDAPYRPSGWKPEGALLVLPREAPGYNYGPPSNDSTTTPPPQDQADLEKVNENIMERLRQEQGSDRGVYYVYLPDGKLQRVQYTSAPIRKAPAGNVHQSTFQSNQQSNHQVVFGSHQTNTQGNSQYSGNYQNFESQFQNQYLPPSGRYQAEPQNFEAQKPAAGDPSQIFAKFAVQEKESSRLEEEAPVSYVASVHYSEVAPISGPIYSYNQSPLTRVVRYAPQFQ